MKFLVCESSTLLGSVALFEDSKLLSYRESPRRGSHSDVMNVFVDQILTEAQVSLKDIDLFVSGVGPGSFTGIRISLNLIKTLAYCHNKPVAGINSLEVLALQCGPTDIPIICMINAFKNMVYIATYKWIDKTMTEIKPPEVIRVQNLKEYVSERSLVVGDGYSAYSEYWTADLQSKLVRDANRADEPQARSVSPFIVNSKRRHQHWSELVPLYLRASEAEENLQGIKFQPLK